MPPVRMRGDGRKAKNPKKTISRLLSYLKQYKKTMIVVVVMFLLIMIVSLIIMVVMMIVATLILIVIVMMVIMMMLLRKQCLDHILQFVSAFYCL